MLISSHSTNTLTNTGTITFTIVGGVGPYTYTVTGLNDLNGQPFNYTTNGNINDNSIVTTINNLTSGSYSITVTDHLNIIANDIITVDGPLPLQCNPYVSLFPTGTNTTGVITIEDVQGGIGPYFYKVTKGANIIQGPLPWVAPSILVTLPFDNNTPYGVDVYDSATPPHHCKHSGLTINGTASFVVTATATNSHCYDSPTGKIDILVTGGQTPYLLKVTGSYVNSVGQLTTFNSVGDYHLTGVHASTTPYTISVTGSTNAVTSTQVTVGFDVGQMVMLPDPQLAAAQCDNTHYSLPFYISNANFAPVVVGSPVQIQYANEVDFQANNWQSYTPTGSETNYVNTTTPMFIYIPVSYQINDFIKIRYVSPPQYGAPCYSNTINYDKTDIQLPAIAFAISQTGINNNIQTTPGTGQFKFDISYNTVGYSRAPYTIKYKVNGGPVQTLSSIYNFPYVLTGPTVPSGANTQTTFIVTVTDNKGCVTQAVTKTVIVPITALDATVVTTIISLIAGQPGVYQHKITAIGGIGQHFYNSPTGNVIPSTGLIITNNQSMITPVVYDSTGNLTPAHY